VASELGGALQQFGGSMPQRDPLLGSGSHAPGVPAPDSAYDYPYGLFEEALDKDAHLQAVISQRKAAALGLPRTLIPANGTPEARAACAIVQHALDNIGAGSAAHGDGGLERDLWELLDALPYGLAVSEVVWEWVETQRPDIRSKGPTELSPGTSPSMPAPGRYLLPRALLSRHPRRFIFDAQGALRLLTAAEPADGEPVPPRKFIVFTPYGRHEHPYGTPLLRSVWWYSWFKRQALKYWLLHCEKYGMPAVVLRHPADATLQERQSFRRVVGSIQQESGLVVPEGVELQLLEASRSGGPAAYQALIELCNAEMSKAILGQTLTIDTPGGGHGSYAMARVHQAVRSDLTQLDAQALLSCLSSTLVRWIVELNGGTPAAAPHWELEPVTNDQPAS
jgi:phage gp29-like protein